MTTADDQYVRGAIDGIERLIMQAKITDEEDKHNITDVFTLFFRSLRDHEYSISGIGSTMTDNHLQYKYEAGTEKSPFFTVGVVGITELSMRSLTCLENHDGVYDMYIEAVDRQNVRKGGTTSVLSVGIRLFKSSVHERVKHTWMPHYFMEINDTITGLIINRQNKDTAQRIVREVMNMDKDGVEPAWSNKLSDNPKTYLLCASPIRSFTLAFYLHMRAMFADELLNTVIRIDEDSRSLGFVYLTIIIHCAAVERESNADDKRKADPLRKTLPATNSIRHVKTTRDTGWWSKFKKSFYNN